MNAVIENMISRRSVKAYKPDMVPMELIEEVVKAGTYAPTGMNMQSPVIVAVVNKKVRDRLSRMNASIMGTSSDPFYGAPVVLVVLADKNRPTAVYDGTLVMGNMLNAAHSLGLGSCWIQVRGRSLADGTPSELVVRGILGLPEELGVLCIIALGHKAAERKLQDETKLKWENVHINGYR